STAPQAAAPWDGGSAGHARQTPPAPPRLGRVFFRPEQFAQACGRGEGSSGHAQTAAESPRARSARLVSRGCATLRTDLAQTRRSSQADLRWASVGRSTPGHGPVPGAAFAATWYGGGRGRSLSEAGTVGRPSVPEGPSPRQAKPETLGPSLPQ